MSINKRAQCKSSYQDYLTFQSRQLIAQMTPEARQRIAEQIQARIILQGEPIVNRKAYEATMKLLRNEV